MSDKRAMVTGASEGIGRAFARKLAREGYSLTLVARNEERLKSLIRELSGEGHQTLGADLSSDKGVEDATRALASHHHDVLINNAGNGNYGRFNELSLDKHRAMLRLNCEALTALSYAFLSQARAGDSLMNVSSTLAFLPLPGSALYAASKAFVTSFSESLWYENKSRDVFVMGLCPGLTQSEFNKRAGGTEIKAPAMMIQSAEKVADIGYRAMCGRKKPTVLCGETNHAMASISRIVPRKMLVSMMGGARMSN